MIKRLLAHDYFVFTVLAVIIVMAAASPLFIAVLQAEGH